MPCSEFYRTGRMGKSGKVSILRRFVLTGTVVLASLTQPLWPRHQQGECGTSRETLRESLFHHRQMLRARRTRPMVAAPRPIDRDAGNIAVIEDTGGVVERRNQFNLDGWTLAFTPAGQQYRYAVSQQGYDAAAAASGAPLVALDDDDSRPVALPFAFPFFGARYNQVYVNSDGNLTFTAGDNASTDRSLGRTTAGPPRIAPLFDDLNPAQTAGGVRVLADASRVVVSWVRVPEYSESGGGAVQTFQARLYPDGRIEFSYQGVNPASAVVGISPGNLQSGTQLVDFLTDSSSLYPATVAEVFGNSFTLDVVTVAQRFYQTHEDAYDYLAIYNNMGIPALGESTVAYEETVRSSGTGYGVPPGDDGAQFGSPSRLKAVLNLGPLSQYPADPMALVPARAPQADTPLTILAHEAGHLFLAYASVRGRFPFGPPMLGFQLAHWSFLFDSEASVMEGERIADRGASTSPRFLTTDITQAYAPLDQYLMGFRDAAEVPPVFLVDSPSPNFPATQHQVSGIAFDGTRQDIAASDVISAEGRRTPDSSVAQRHFRIAFILVTAQGTTPSDTDLAQLDTYRRQFEMFYSQAASGHAAVDTTLRRNLTLSLSPAGGVVAGRSTKGSVSVSTPPAADLAVQLSAPNGNATVAPQVTIPAGALSATFLLSGIKSGVEEVQATPTDPGYETAYARVQVADSSQLKLLQVPAATGAIAVRLTDPNNLPYAGAGILATPSAGGNVVPSEAFTDATGTASFVWNPGSAAVNHLTLAVDGQPATTLDLAAGTAVPVISSVQNAASLLPGIAPGALQTITGSHLAGARVLLGDTPLTQLSTADSQIVVYVPADTPLGAATLTVNAPSGASASVTVEVAAAAPGIFPQGVLHAGTGQTTASSPVHAGDYLEIYCTGLGSATPLVFIGAVPVQPVYSGPAPGFTGVQQVNVSVPSGLASGPQPVVLSVASAHSNTVDIMVQ